MGFGGGPTFITFLSKIIQVNYVINFDLVLCEIFFTLVIVHWPCFHDNTLLFATRVHSYPHFVYYFVIMTCFWTLIILVSIDFLVNCHACFTLFSRDPFFKSLEGCYSLYHTFPISNLIPEPSFGFFTYHLFQIRSHT